MVAPVQIERCEGLGDEVLQRVSFASGNDEVFGLGLLQNFPYGFDVLGRPAPVAPDVEPAQGEALFGARCNAAGGTDDFWGNEALRA